MEDDSMTNSEAWDYAIGMIKVDGLEPTADFKKYIEKQKKGVSALSHSHTPLPHLQHGTIIPLQFLFFCMQGLYTYWKAVPLFHLGIQDTAVFLQMTFRLSR